MTLQELKLLVWDSVRLTLVTLLTVPFFAFVLLPLQDGKLPEFTEFYKFLVSPLLFKTTTILLSFGIYLIAGGLFYLMNTLLLALQ
mgnify:CR=1 FL=1